MLTKPINKEDEYFLRLELEQKKQDEEARQKRIALEHKAKLRELHYMHCPKCGTLLQEIDFKGVKLDKCFACDGIWLDSGELDILAGFEQTGRSVFLNVFRVKSVGQR